MNALQPIAAQDIDSMKAYAAHRRALENVARMVVDEVIAKQEEKQPQPNTQPIEKLITIPKFCELTGASKDWIREKCWCTDPKLHPFPCIKRTGKTGRVNIRLYLSQGLQWLQDEATGAWKEGKK